MSVIDLSAATPASRNHVAEKEFGEQLQLNALAQMLALLNQGKPQISPAHRQAVELLQTEGIAVAVEFLAQLCDLGEHAWIKTIRAQIVDSHIKAEQAAQETRETEKHDAPADDEPSTEGYLNVHVGYAPEATAENAHAILTGLLLAFV